MELCQLPTEVLSLVLSNIQTKDLLGIASTSRSINHLARVIIRGRIRRAATISNEDTMYFECFHPVERNLRPALKCQYHETPGFDMTQSYDDISMSDIHQMYTHYQLTTFPPHRNPFASTESNLARRHRSHFWPLQTRIAIEQEERFTQLVARSGLLFSFSKFIFVGLELQLDVVRVFKEWLKEAIEDGGERLLWLHEKQHVGIKVHIQRDNELAHLDQSDRFVLTFMELHIRSSYLRMQLEDYKCRHGHDVSIF